MVPVYSSTQATIYEGAAEDVLPTLDSSSVDLVVTDPPYGVNYQSNFRQVKFDGMANDDGSPEVAHVLSLALKALRGGRHIYYFGPPVDGLATCQPVTLIWHKGNMAMGNLSAPWSRSHDEIHFAVNVPSEANRRDGKGKLAARLRKGSVLTVARLNSRANSRHPTEKPVALMRYLIESSSVIGETVLDPFAGSGSTLVAAILEGRKTIGIEIDPGYCAVMVSRVKAAEAVVTRMDGL